MITSRRIITLMLNKCGNYFDNGYMDSVGNISIILSITTIIEYTSSCII